MNIENTKENDWNSIVLIGEILNKPEYFYEVFDRTYFIMNMKVKIKDEKFVNLPIVIDDMEYKIDDYKENQIVFVKGIIKTERIIDENNKEKLRKLQMYVKPRVIEFLDNNKIKTLNNAIIQGYICSKIVLKPSNNGKEKLALLVASNKEDMSNYIRCFVIGQRAMLLKKYKKGEKIELHGHIEYNEIRKEHQLFVKWCDKTDSGYVNKDGYQFGEIN